MRARLLLGLLIWTATVCGSPGETLCLTSGVEPPVLIHKVDPEYTRDARQAQVQGNVAIELTVDEEGSPRFLKVLSPIGFGLDEKARRAVEQWRFRPARVKERIVRSIVLAEVRFRLPQGFSDAAVERRRTAFNVAVAQAKGRDLSLVDGAVARLRELARERFAPAMHFVAKLDDILGRADPAKVFAMIKAAADANYGPALYEMGTYHLSGKHVKRDPERALRLMHEAAVLGSAAAQNDLGARYEAGNGVPLDPERARRYFRLCAASGNARCQYRLARLLLGAQDCPERDRLQAVAWCQLAGEQIPEARQTAEDETARMNPEQLEWVNRIRPQLTAQR